MRVQVYSTRPYDRAFLEAANRGRHELRYSEAALSLQTAVLADGCRAVCAFVDDDLSEAVLEDLARRGVELVTLRATGFNNVDLGAADRLNLTVMRVSIYSPHAVAEFSVALMLSLSRRLHRAYNRVREGNFLLDGLLGFDMHGKTVGVVGTGRIGEALVGILRGFGCRVLMHDLHENPNCRGPGCEYVSLSRLWSESDIVSLHVPLTPDTYHMVDAQSLSRMKPGAMLINTSRGALVDTRALIDALKRRHLGAVGLDVYEEEGHLYFRDLSDEIIDDDTFARLLSFPNVLVTGHQAFFTREAVTTIAETTLRNIDDFAAGRSNDNRLGPQWIARP